MARAQQTEDSRADEDVAPRRTRRNKRDVLLREAARLFKDRGYEQTGIDDIGEAAGVSGPALYYHFKGKEGLLGALIRELLTEVQALLHGVVVTHEDPRDALEAFLAGQIDMALEHKALMAISLRELRHAPAEERLAFQRQGRLLRTERQHLLQQVRPDLTETELWLAQDAIDGIMYSIVNVDEAIDREIVRTRFIRMAQAVVYNA